MSGQRKPWDLTSTHALDAAAEWVRQRADATVVMVVRGGDYAFAVAPGVTGADARVAVEQVLPDAAWLAENRRREKQEAATRKRAAEISGKIAQQAHT